MRTTHKMHILLICSFLGLYTPSAIAHHSTPGGTPYDSMYPTDTFGYNGEYCGDFGSSWSGDHEYFCMTDNDSVSVYRQSSLNSTAKQTIANALVEFNIDTVLDIWYPSSPTYSGSSETDIIYQDLDYAIPYAGVAWCDDASGLYVCDQHYVGFVNDSFSPELACHESGHAVGLTHGVDAYPYMNDDDINLGCMASPRGSGLGPHNKSLITDAYLTLGGS